MDMSRYKKIFMEESLEHLSKLNQLILDLEKNPQNIDVVNTIFREAHSIKGMSASMGYEPIAELTHKLEDLMDMVRKGKLTITRGIVDVLLSSGDILEKQLKAVDKNEDPGEVIGDIILMLDTAMSGKLPAGKEMPGGKPEPKPEPEAKKEPEPKKEGTPLTYKVMLRIDPNVPKPHIKALLGVKKLTELGKIVGIIPSLQELKKGGGDGSWLDGAENAEKEIRVSLVTGVGIDDIERALVGLPFIVGHEIVILKAGVEKRDSSPGEGGSDKDTPIGGDPTGQVESAGKPQENNQSLFTDEPFFTETYAAKEPLPTDDTPVMPEKEPQKEKTAAEKPLKVEEILPSGEVLAELPRSVRINTDLLEKFMNLVGELLITKSRIKDASKLLANQALDDAVYRLDSLIGELHAQIIMVRMMPLESIMARMPRLVRDLARAREKEVDFTITGSDIELDRSILEELTDPLVHILRNAIDHGLETPEERESLGKPKTGKITINAFRERDLVILEVSDDGRGMDPMKIREAAISRKIITKEQADRLSNKDLTLLTFMPNLSTSKEVTDISGRGVGMDVVKTRVESLGGSIGLETELGKGAKIILYLPLTVAIIQALLIKVAGEKFVLPLIKIIKSAEVDRSAIQKSQNQHIILMNGEMIRLVNMGEILGLGNGKTKKDVVTMVITEVRGKSIGLEVDEIIGSQEVFIKSLGMPLEKIPGFSGVTILGDGKPSLILDIPNLVV